jgi:hypothetical protein
MHAYDGLPAERFAGKIVIDANNYYPGRDGERAELDTGETSSSGLLAQPIPRCQRPYAREPRSSMNAFSSLAEGWCWLHASRSSRTMRTPSTSRFACS